MIICPIGMFILGWTADAQTHWIAPQIGTAILLFGLTLAFNSIQNLLVISLLRDQEADNTV
jgi:DHA1 family multidrug resistance protein-like MFS transporter